MEHIFSVWIISMPNIIIFYWVPGSCGDFVQSLFLSNPDDYQGVMQQFSEESTGRMVPKIDDFFKEQFDFQPDAWYLREWSVTDCQKIQLLVTSLSCKYFVIPTHSLKQVNYLKLQFSNCKTMGITYPKNMFPLVLKNWCKKVAPDCDQLNTFYASPMHRYLKNKGAFGEFMLLEQLRHRSDLPIDTTYEFDISLRLEDLYNSKLSMFNGLINNTQLINIKLQSWLQKQNQIYCYSLNNLHPILKESLGYNSLSDVSVPLHLELDLFDNIFIKEYCRGHTTITLVPNFKNLQEANDFFTGGEY